MAILEGLSDPHGSVLFGWLEPGVFYARFEKEISAELGASFAGRFTTLIGSTLRVRYFNDSSSVTSYDLHAMASVVDALLSKKKQFQLIVALTWQGALGETARRFAAGVECLEYLTRSQEFAARLQGSAPSTWHQVLRAPDSVPAAAPLAPQEAYTYVFDLKRFEQGQFTATRRQHLAMAPPGAWICVARNDEHALQLARQAARAEWAVPSSRAPEQFSVQFSDLKSPGMPGTKN